MEVITPYIMGQIIKNKIRFQRIQIDKLTKSGKPTANRALLKGNNFNFSKLFHFIR